MAEAQNKEEAAVAIRKQIEFYLSDANLPYDKFLFTLSQASLPTPSSAPGTGWVRISTLASFKRMRPYSSYDVPFIASTLASSTILVVSEEKDRVRRKEGIKPPGQDAMARSVYVKAFPEESSDPEDRGKLQIAIERWFKQFGEVKAVRMRRDGGVGADGKASGKTNTRIGKFKGSVFAEFENEEEAKKFVERGQKGDIPRFEAGPDDGAAKPASTDKPATTDGAAEPASADVTMAEASASTAAAPAAEEPIVVMSKQGYVEMKAKEKGIPLDSIKISGGAGPTPKRTGGERPFSAFRELAQESKAAKGGKGKKQEEKRPVFIMVEGKKVDITEDGKVADVEQLPWTKETILRFEGAGEGGHFKDLKTAVFDIQQPSFVEYKAGEPSGLMSFREPVNDAKLKQLQDAKIEFGGKQLTWRRLPEEEQKTFHVNRANHRAAAELEMRANGGYAASGRGGGRGGRGGGRGGRGGGRGGRGGGRDRNEEREAPGGGVGGSATAAIKRKRDEEGNAKSGQASSGGPPSIATAGAGEKEPKKAKVDAV